jgi:hypothetical protein
MDQALTMPHVWFDRGAKPAVFDLPDASLPNVWVAPPPASDGAASEAARETRAARELAVAATRPAQLRAEADRTEEVDPNDVLAEFPADPEQRFELRVPEVLLARVCELTASLPREERLHEAQRSAAASQEVVAVRGLGRMGWLFATAVGTCAGVAVAAVLAFNMSVAMAPTGAPQKAARSAAKILEARVELVSTAVPTVAFDSLPRAGH